jgi:hypothetical protein
MRYKRSHKTDATKDGINFFIAMIYEFHKYVKKRGKKGGCGEAYASPESKTC